MANVINLRRACRLSPGQTSADCPDGTVGNVDGKLDEGDLDPEIQVLGFEARYGFLEAHPGDYVGARAAQLAALQPHLDQLNAAHSARATEDSSMCKCHNTDEDDYSFDGGSINPAAQARRDAAIFNAPPRRPGPVTAPQAPKTDDDTDEDAARAAMNSRSRDAWRNR